MRLPANPAGSSSPAALARGLLLAALAGCGGGAAPPPPSQLPREGDALILQQVLDGTLAPEEGLRRVSRSGGWPIQTSAGFLFAIVDGGLGPYRVAGEAGFVPSTEMRSERGVAWALVPIADPDGQTYQYTTRFGDPVPDPWSRSYGSSGSQQVSYVRYFGAHLERWPLVGDAAVTPRTVRVWVPSLPPTHFLYAHDGQNLFDGAGPSGGWMLDRFAGPSTLVVGIDSTPTRLWDYTPVQDLSPLQGGGADAYADFLEATVRPLIEAPERYGPATRRGLIGSSLGGLVSYWAALRHPDSWDFVASLSGTMGWGSIQGGVRNQTVIEAWQALPACPAATLYLDTGGGPGAGCVDADGDGTEDDAANAADNYCENAQFRRVLEGLGCTPRLTSVWVQGARHDEPAWRSRSPAILGLFEAL